MRILVTTPYFFPHAGGSQKYIADLYSQLIKKHPEVKVDVICYNTDGVSKTEVYKGLNIYRVGCLEILPGQFSLPNYIELIGLIRKLKDKHGKYDLVNAHTRFFDNALWSPSVARYLGAKSLLTDHCAYSPQHSSKIVTFVAKVLDLLFTPLAAKLYNEVTAVSFATKKYLATLGISVDKVFHGGVVVKDFTRKTTIGDDRSVPQIKRKFNRNDILVTFLGRVIYSKGPQILLDAAIQMGGKKRNTYFVIAGKGDLLEKLKRQRQKNVFFTGNLDQSEVIKLLSATDILVLPTMHHEGFPIVLLEAGSIGCAVVATNRGGIGELIEDNKTGLIIEPTASDVEKKLSRLINEPKLRATLVANLQEKVKRQFDSGIISEAYFKYINS